MKNLATLLHHHKRAKTTPSVIFAALPQSWPPLARLANTRFRDGHTGVGFASVRGLTGYPDVVNHSTSAPPHSRIRKHAEIVELAFGARLELTFLAVRSTYLEILVLHVWNKLVCRTDSIPPMSQPDVPHAAERVPEAGRTEQSDMSTRSMRPVSPDHQTHSASLSVLRSLQR